MLHAVRKKFVKLSGRERRLLFTALGLSSLLLMQGIYSLSQMMRENESRRGRRHIQRALNIHFAEKGSFPVSAAFRRVTELPIGVEQVALEGTFYGVNAYFYRCASDSSYTLQVPDPATDSRYYFDAILTDAAPNSMTRR